MSSGVASEVPGLSLSMLFHPTRENQNDERDDGQQCATNNRNYLVLLVRTRDEADGHAADDLHKLDYQRDACQLANASRNVGDERPPRAKDETDEALSREDDARNHVQRTHEGRHNATDQDDESQEHFCKGQELDPLGL